MDEASAAPEVGPRGPRPLSPHIGVWRWHITMLGSILNRMTGVAAYGAALIAAWAVVALALGPDAYGTFLAVSGSWLGRLVMFGVTAAFFYHLAAGIRHLIWDTGRALSLKAANLGTWATLGVAAVATLTVWLIAWRVGALA